MAFLTYLDFSVTNAMTDRRNNRSIFPCGTVSGAPKVRAMELIAELEREKRGVYAGGVGYFGYNTIKADGTIEEGGMDTCVIFCPFFFFFLWICKH